MLPSYLPTYQVRMGVVSHSYQYRINTKIIPQSKKVQINNYFSKRNKTKTQKSDLTLTLVLILADTNIILTDTIAQPTNASIPLNT